MFLAGVKYGLKPNTKCTLGRAGADLVFNDDTSVSRMHANILVRNDGILIKDLGSRFGTYVGDHAITSSESNSSSQAERLKGQEEKLLEVGQR